MRESHGSKTTPVKRVAIYARRSRREGDKDVSIKEQIEQCQRWVDERGHTTTHVYEERRSGATTEDRPVFMNMLREAEQGDFDLVVTLDLSRFSRGSVREAAAVKHRLAKAGVSVVHVLDDAKLAGEMGEVVESVLQSGAREYLKQVASRVAIGLTAAVLRGHWPGGQAPFGYRVLKRQGWDGRGRRESRLVVNEPEATAVRRIFDLYAGGLGYQKVVEILNAEETPKPRGRARAWTIGTVRGILSRPEYKGDLVRGRPRRGGRNQKPKFFRGGESGPIPADQPPVGYEKRGAVPAIVSETIWNKVQDLVRSRTTTTWTGGTPRLLSGLARCAVCGGPLIQSNGCSKGDRRYRYYRCRRARHEGAKDACAAVSIAERALDPVVLSAVRVLTTGLGLRGVEEEVRRALPKPVDVDVDALHARRRRLADRRDELLLDTEQTGDFVREGLARLHAEDERLARQMAKACAPVNATRNNAVSKAALAASQRLDQPETDEGRAALRCVLRLFVARLEVAPAPRGTPIPVRLELLTPSKDVRATRDCA